MAMSCPLKSQKFASCLALVRSRAYGIESLASSSRCQVLTMKISSSMRSPIRTLFDAIPPYQVHRLSQSRHYLPNFTTYTFGTSAKMATEFSKVTLSDGNGSDYPQTGDMVTMEYTGWLYDASAPNNRGTRFDSSEGRGDFKIPIGIGKVIKGWDEGVTQMTLGERAVLTIPPNMAYEARGFPGLIPPNSSLIFEVRLKGINDKVI